MKFEAIALAATLSAVQVTSLQDNSTSQDIDVDAGHHKRHPCHINGCNLHTGKGCQDESLAKIGEKCNNQQGLWCAAPKDAHDGQFVQCSFDDRDGVCVGVEGTHTEKCYQKLDDPCNLEDCNLRTGDGCIDGAVIGDSCDNTKAQWCAAPGVFQPGYAVQCDNDSGPGKCIGVGPARKCQPMPEDECHISGCNLLTGEGCLDPNASPIGYPCNNDAHIWCVKPVDAEPAAITICSAASGDGFCVPFNDVSNPAQRCYQPTQDKCIINECNLRTGDGCNPGAAINQPCSNEKEQWCAAPKGYDGGVAVQCLGGVCAGWGPAEGCGLLK